jgi:hypothetical protein
MVAKVCCVSRKHGQLDILGIEKYIVIFYFFYEITQRSVGKLFHASYCTYKGNVRFISLQG